MKPITTRSRIRAGALALVVGAVLTVTACGPNSSAEANAAATKLVPDTAFLFSSIATDPGNQQKTELYNLSKKLPTELQADNADATIEKWFEKFLNDDDLNYQNDVKPWLGNEAAIAMFPSANPEDEPFSLAYLKTTDEAKTREVFTKNKVEEKSYTFVDNYVVLVDDDNRLDQGGTELLDKAKALSSNDKGSLAETARFKEAKKELSGQKLALGWVDIPALVDFPAFKQIMNEAAPGETPADRELREKSINEFKAMGYVAYSAHAKNDAIIMESITENVTESSRNVLDQPWSSKLPADVSGLFEAPNFKLVWSAFKDGLNKESGLSELPELNTLLDVLGDRVMVVTGSLDTANGKLPEIALLSSLNDLNAAKTQLGGIYNKLEPELGGMLTKTTFAGNDAYLVSNEGKTMALIGISGDRLAISTSEAFLNRVVAGDGNLENHELFTKSVAKTSKSAGLAYVDLSKVIAAIDSSEELKSGLSELEKNLSTLTDSTVTTTTAPNKSVEELKAHLEAFGSQSWIENNRVRSEMRLTFK